MRLIAVTVCGAANVNNNKGYHTSARMTLAYNKSTSGHGTDGRTECNAICGTLLRRRAPHNKKEGNWVNYSHGITYVL